MTMKRDYTGRFTVGQTIQINNRSSLHHGQTRVVVAISDNRNAHPYRLDDGLYYPERELSALPAAAHDTCEPHDTDSGLGIGGINNDQSMPFVPSAAAIARVQHMHDTDTVCRRCGASAYFDGAMFTTVGGNLCDDCAA